MSVDGTRDGRPNGVEDIERSWAANPRWLGIERDYGALDVMRLRPTVAIEYTLARLGGARLWQLLREEDYVACGCRKYGFGWSALADSVEGRLPGAAA